MKIKKRPKSTRKSSRVPRTQAHPLLPQVKALVDPFNALPGVAKHLVDPLPSQSYKLKARGTATCGNQQTLVMLISPCAAGAVAGIDANFPSAILVNTSAGGRGATIHSDGLEAGTSAVKSSNSLTTIIPSRPYAFSTAGATWRLVSYSVRIRYTGTALNANGTLKFLPNDLGAFQLAQNSTWQNIVDFVDGSAHTIMRSIYNNAVYEFNGLGATEWGRGVDEIYMAQHDEGDDVTATTQVISSHWCPFLIGQNSSTVNFGQPGMMLVYTNNSTTPCQFELELVENWEMRTSSNTPFHTDSHANPELSAEVFRTVVSGHMHAASSSTPNVKASLKAINSASKSPLGKAVIAAALA